ncbi:ATP-dependent helicase/nuclease subunit B [Roseiarcus fermentans]|uniref:ATP-dependent helicase/nuclease subunit B n=1 Tax=Roseiarcus fermentans TaxID=1473586 RepID=A0A366ETH3_9HYPH|nr:double-strand break repair protein AddB [Roseiarcus fermentans]RBP05697.1 ATP-dependent helicase/nuclease subunit B [Roseiarcus fermentans]
MLIRAPRVFTIPPGAPFLATLSRALIDGELIEGFPGSGGPLALAEATIYVPTRRAASALADALLAASGGRAVLLPRIAPLGAFEPDDSTVFADPGADDASPAGPRPAVGALTRRHVLALLVRQWGQALRGAIRSADADGLDCDPLEPALVASTPAQAYALAGDLAALIDDLIIEGVKPKALDALAPDAAYDRYWRITLDFLKIAFAAWPAWLAENGLIDRAARVAALVDAEVAALAAGARARRGPTIIAGSTGANRATARLIAAVARSDRGAVVLPGLDTRLDERAWDMIGASDGDEQGLAGHPQALLRRLIGLIGVARADVRPLGRQAGPLAARAALIGEALRPAESTDAWRDRSAALAPPAVAAALESVAVIVADHETEEALALAIAMREVLETPGKTAALITPDPSIARRVAAELARWGVEVEDSAGRSLGETEAGALARLLLNAAADFRPLALQALLAHPSARLGRDRAGKAAAARALELGVFRAAPIVALDDLDAAFAAARAAAADRHAHPAVRSVGDARRAEGEGLARDCAAVLGPLRRLGSAPLRDWLDAHRAALAAVLAAPDDAAVPHGAPALDDLIEEWRAAAGEGFPCTLADYARLFEEALFGVRAPPAPSGCPRLAILGLLEARLLAFDRTLVAGLDEKVWPPAVNTDAFLNRPMRARLGLSPPERRIGQTAHDFVAALGARETILSRARKRGGEPTVASRFLQRLGAAAGAEAIGAAERRGAQYLAWARALDKPDSIAPAPRPEPTPPADKRPRSLSVTRIETLRRDPYAIYAERILRLKGLDPVQRALGPREAGEAWHGALEDFSIAFPAGALPPEARDRLAGLARAHFAELLRDPAFAGLNWPNIEKAIDVFIGFEAEARTEIERIFVERQGEIVIPLRDGSQFRLTARADRIDRLVDGEATLIDYKSGRPPGKKEVTIGLAPQLTLEAAILMRGGFADLGAMTPRRALYIKLGGADGGEAREAAEKGEDIAELAERHFADLKVLLDQFVDPGTPYLSRPMPKFASRFADYDHLARVKEWSKAGGAGEPTAGEAG